LKNTAFRFANEEKKLIMTVDNLDYINLLTIIDKVTLDEYISFEKEIFNKFRYQAFYFGNFTKNEVLSANNDWLNIIQKNWKIEEMKKS